MYGMPFSLAIWSYVFVLQHAQSGRELTVSGIRIITFFLSFAILWLDNTDYVVIGLVLSFTIIFLVFLLWTVLVPYMPNPSQYLATRGAKRVPAVKDKSIIASKEEFSSGSKMKKVFSEGVAEAVEVPSVGLESASGARASSKRGLRRPVWSPISLTMV